MQPINRLSWTVLAFSIAFAAVHAIPVLLGKPFGPYPVITTGAVVDLLTPLIMVPLYWLLYRVDQTRTPSLAPTWSWIAFLVFTALWVQGDSIHLPTNAISLVLKSNLISGSTHDLNNFYDEVLSHYLWHTGMVGLSGLIMFRQWQRPFAGERSPLALEAVAGSLYGAVFFGAVVEGGTAPLGLPFAALVTLFGLVWGRKRFRQQPLLAFFFTGYLVATIFFVGWAIYWRGLPQFTHIGIID
jgi:hypothetical protein